MPSKFTRPRSLRHAYLVVFGLALASAAYSAPVGTADANLSALLKKQTQAFSEAGQRGDAATLDRYLDRDVVFTNETGAIASKKDLVDGVTPTPASSQDRRIEVTNWALRRQGDVATATFVDVVTQKFDGQTLVLRFQSTETWAKRHDGWKMIASHTMNVQRPPAAISLPAADLDAYVGSYELDAAHIVKIARGRDGLTISANGSMPIPLQVEVKDVLFTDVSPNTRKIFQRDAAGHVIGYINRRDGVDLTLKKTAG